METSWIKAFESTKVIRAEMVREMLDQNEISAVLVNKKDSVYPMFGKWEVHVLSQDLTRAQNIINDEGTFTESE
jgi:hypothetical protein